MAIPNPGGSIEMILGEPVLRRQARALLGWMNDQEAITALLGRNPLPGEDVDHFRTRVAEARSAVAQRLPSNLEDPISEGAESQLESVGRRPEIASSFHGMRWHPAIIDLRKVLSFQKIISVDGLTDRLEGAKEDAKLLELCIPSQQPSPPSGAFTDGDGKGFTISSFNPNLRIAAGQLGEANVSPGPGMPTVKMQAVTLLVYMGTSYLQVVRYRGRSFIRDGYHRAAGLLGQGIYQVPCIFIEAESFDQVGAGPGAFSYEILYGDRPPFLADFWDDEVASDATQVAVRKVVRIRGEEFVVPR